MISENKKMEWQLLYCYYYYINKFFACCSETKTNLLFAHLISYLLYIMNKSVIVGKKILKITESYFCSIFSIVK